jgi:hypothetical protein
VSALHHEVLEALRVSDKVGYRFTTANVRLFVRVARMEAAPGEVAVRDGFRVIAHTLASLRKRGLVVSRPEHTRRGHLWSIAP